jgi:hypothetical protein
MPLALPQLTAALEIKTAASRASPAARSTAGTWRTSALAVPPHSAKLIGGIGLSIKTAFSDAIDDDQHQIIWRC